MSEAGTIKLDNIGEPKAAMVFGQMNEPPGNGLRVASVGLTMAEKSRDEGRDILFVAISIVSRSPEQKSLPWELGWMPSAVGHQPTLAEATG